MKHALAAVCLALSGSPLAAQKATAPKLSLELNAAAAVEGACKLSFVLRNETGVEITKFVAETVLFTKEGGVQLLTLFDFGNLPEKRARVRQFQVPGEGCEGLGMVLLNGATTCEGQGLGPAACEAALDLSSRLDIALEG